MHLHLLQETFGILQNFTLNREKRQHSRRATQGPHIFKGEKFIINSNIIITSFLGTHSYLTVGSSLTLAVMSTASSSFFSTNWSKSHNSFLGPKRPFLPFMPCFKICSRTIKKCCNGMWSESSWCPNLRLESRTSFMTSLRMLTKLLFSIWIGSRSEKEKNDFKKA